MCVYFYCVVYLWDFIIDLFQTKNDQGLENVKELKPLCDKCGNTYDTVQKLKKHIKIHRGDKYTCPECGKDLSTPYTLKVSTVFTGV